MAVKESIISCLKKIDCCNRCVLRMAGVRGLEHHLVAESPNFKLMNANASNLGHEYRTQGKSETSDVQDANESPIAGIPSTCVCPACIGLLQINHDDIAFQAVEKLHQLNFKALTANTFSISAHMPAQLSVRQRSLILHLESELGPPIDVKEIFKLLVRDAFAKKSGMEFDVASNLSLVFKMNHAETELDFQFLTGTFQLMVEIPASKLKVTTKRAKGIVRHQGASGDKIASAVMKVGLADFVNHRQCPPPLVETIPQISDLSFQLEPIFIAGRYCKLERHISNSIWIINGQRLAEHSMEELIGDHLDAFFEAKGHKFSSAGREDSDVLMLGDGRPFYFELVSPARGSASKVELEQLRQSMIESSNGKIHVRDLQIVTRESTSVLKESASSKSKSYRCAVILSTPVTQAQLDNINSQFNLAVKQKNPLRVPRRADLLRDKVIESISCKFKGSPTRLLIDLKTSAGTYVKEFMHSDEGRTVPSLKSLLGQDSVAVESLDVLQIHLDWPERIE